jgi:enoyl-CoA hydratase
MIERTTNDGVLLLVMTNPPVNAVSEQLKHELIETFRSVPDDVGAVVLTASGTRSFCAGKDLRDAAASAPSDAATAARRGREMLDAIRECPVPVVAAVNGPAVGGGVSILAMCDVIVAARGTWIRTPEIEVGLLGAFSHLASLVGERRARYLYLTGQRTSVEEMYTRGSVAVLAEPESLIDEALTVAAEIAGKNSVATRAAKEAILATADLPMTTAYRIEQSYTAQLQLHPDVETGASAGDGGL